MDTPKTANPIWAETREKITAELRAAWIKAGGDLDAFESQKDQLYAQEISKRAAEDRTARQREKELRAKITGFGPHDHL